LIRPRSEFLTIPQIGLIPGPQNLWVCNIAKIQEANSSNVWGVRMLQQTVHLLDRKLHGEELVEETECSGGASAIASHPRFYMINFIVDLVNDLMIGLQPVEPLKVIR
jgi:hypothetical protein